MKVKKRILLRSGFIGAVIGIAVQLTVGIIHMFHKESVTNVFNENIFSLIEKPCTWIIFSLVNAGLIRKHDGLAVVIVFFVYSGILGFVIGIAVYLLITWFRTVLRRI